jgi:NAD(P)-dependent dehydrogenase (short-subunit alcohol dehydrogenase family)
MTPTNGSGTRVFITGGASGLGRALAEEWSQRGARVCIADINEARGAETLAVLLRRGDAELLRCDVTRDEDLRAARERLEERWGGVDVVVNNAGVALAGGIDEVSLDDWRWIIDINLLGVVRGCREFTPLFKKQQRGHFVNVASIAGLLDVPLMSGYNATKAAVVSLSETLQNELAEHGIGVTVVCPSFFQTNLHETMRSQTPELIEVTKSLLARSAITAADVARETVDAVADKRFYVLPHLEGRAAWRMKRYLPRAAYRAVIAKQFRRIQRAHAAGKR